jgi:alanyl-tRNA synthetase
VSVQENVKLKQVEQLIRDKAKRFQNRIDATNSRNKWSAVSSSGVDLNPEGAKDLAYDWGN